MGKVTDDDICNESDNETFEAVIEQRVSRRAVLGGDVVADRQPAGTWIQHSAQ